WLLPFAFLAGPALAAPAPPVTLQQSPSSITLSNQIVSLDVNKATGNLDALKYSGSSLLAEPAYLDWIVDKNNHFQRPQVTIVTDPRSNSGDLAEVTFTQSHSNASPFDVELHYLLRRGDPGPYCFAIFSHHNGYPQAGIAQSRFVMRLTDNV